MTVTITDEPTTAFKKVLRPGTIPTSGGGRMSVYVRVTFDGAELSIAGVEGRSAGQIDMGYKHRNDEDDDSRYSRLVMPSDFNFADGWSSRVWLDLLDVWKRWHLNGLRSECEHQRALGWKYDTHRDPDADAGLPCPTCGYRIGSAWRREDVPADVLDFLRNLPDADRAPA